MRVRAQRRARREKCSFSTALFRVRRSEVLLFLSRNPGRRLTYPQIADGTAVPVSAVRQICKVLARQDHELIRGRDDG
jgi:hypothetical protein